MTSPFSSYQDYYEAEGPIYTFANNPAIIGILVFVSALMFIYFIYFTFTLNKGHSSAKNPIVLSLLILTSAASFVADSVYSHYQNRNESSPVSMTTEVPKSAPTHRFQPLALLGMMGGGAVASRRTRRKGDRHKVRRTASGRRRL
ncbi:hypothetical protein IQ268_24155 [Oculatella sp. LEGE 06141]|uniref:hypothetical protein n=1 Tax=Oculatella sp. LEGE 06141 TaxID=1828648 RepID=UPI001881E94B|nr:hypothetical protein [Oculatella sp. LEGE 06141]MBE9181662.1 hypothetical protein [Oculatella sp. LEGE 06141]